VYTPTRNVVFHDYGAQTNGHGNNEWFQRQRDRSRKDALTRAKTIIQIFGGDPTVTAQANLGIYGLGKRRSIQQLMEFARMKDVDRNVGNKGKLSDCVGHEWVPYDVSISPTDNLFDKPDNLDPQPEYPLRTNLVFYQQAEQAAPKIRISINDQGHAEVKQAGSRNMLGEGQRAAPAAGEVNLEYDQRPTLPSFSLLFVLWVFGMCVWCAMFLTPDGGGSRAKRKAKKRAPATTGKDA